MLMNDRHSDFKRLLVIQARIDRGQICPFQIGFEQIACTAETFRHVLASQLQMDAAQMRAFCSMNIETAFKLGFDVIETAGFVTVGGGFGIAVHWIADPKHACTSGFDGADQTRKLLVDIVGTEAVDQRKTARFIVRVERFAQTCDLCVGDAR